MAAIGSNRTGITALPASTLAAYSLTKASGTDYEVSWTAADGVGVAPPPVSGMWYDQRDIPIDAAIAGSVTMQVGFYPSVFVPLFFPVAVTIAAVAVSVANAGSSASLAMGLYTASAATGYPQTLLASGTAAANAASGFPQVTYSGSPKVGPGWGYVGLAFSGSTSPTLWTPTQDYVLVPPWGVPNLNTSTYVTSYLSGSSPTLASNPTVTVNAVTSPSPPPLVFYKVA